jgi:hypothetical protein
MVIHLEPQLAKPFPLQELLFPSKLAVMPKMAHHTQRL